MKRVTAFVLTIAVLLAMAGCAAKSPRKSQAALDAEAAIAAIGEVSLESEELISTAEKLYNILTDAEKAEVDNRLALVEAREAFNRIKEEADAANEQAQKEAIYNNANEAFLKINEAAEICINGMDDVYAAWKFGIYDIDDYTSLTVALWALSTETPHLSSEDLEKACSDKEYSISTLKLGFSYCVFLVEQALENKGEYAKAEELMNNASDLLKELKDEYDDYSYYPKLKEYYAKVASYLEFFKSPSGSFQQLKDTINDYENTIRTYQSDVGFMFD